MAQLSSEERIKRVEMAPAEVQTMVAKAFFKRWYWWWRCSIFI